MHKFLEVKNLLYYIHIIRFLREIVIKNPWIVLLTAICKFQKIYIFHPFEAEIIWNSNVVESVSRDCTQDCFPSCARDGWGLSIRKCTKCCGQVRSLLIGYSWCHIGPLMLKNMSALTHYQCWKILELDNEVDKLMRLNFVKNQYHTWSIRFHFTLSIIRF